MYYFKVESAKVTFFEVCQSSIKSCPAALYGQDDICFLAEGCKKPFLHRNKCEIYLETKKYLQTYKLYLYIITAENWLKSVRYYIYCIDEEFDDGEGYACFF